MKRALVRSLQNRFWPTLVHAVRNAVDHGVESADERMEAGKPMEGLVRLSTRHTDEALFIEVEDDGRGIDLLTLRRRAEERGIRTAANESVDLVFTDGVSSRAEVSELCGRGMGLAATRAACKAELRTVHVETRAGGGTRLMFRFRSPTLRMAREEGSGRRWIIVPNATAARAVSNSTA